MTGVTEQELIDLVQELDKHVRLCWPPDDEEWGDRYRVTVLHLMRGTPLDHTKGDLLVKDYPQLKVYLENWIEAANNGTGTLMNKGD